MSLKAHKTFFQIGKWILTILFFAMWGALFFNAYVEKKHEALLQLPDEVSASPTVLLDVRTPEEWNEVHAQYAQHFDLARLQAGELPNITKDTKIVVYCRSGNRAGQAEDILRENGYTNVINVGGLEDWIKLGGSYSN